MTLADFVLARITEDEAEAMVQVAAHPDAPRDSWLWDRPQGDDDIRAFVIGPARVLAECKAKREIIAMHSPHFIKSDKNCIPNRRVLLVLAQPYVDHADFREEWRADATA